MALYQTNAGDRVLAADINQFYQILKGVAASGETITLIHNNQSLIFQPSSDPSAGTRVVLIKNNAGTVLTSWRYDGLLELLAAAAAPATAIAGSLYWDTVLSALRVNDGTNWRDIAGNNAGPLPNLVLNSDFSRRTVFGLAMPEVFADLSGTTKIDGGAAGSVAANIFTQGAANNEYAWCAGSFVWRDGRASATFKAVATTGQYSLKWRIDGANFIRAICDGAGNFVLSKVIASANTNVATVAQALTLNRWYWLEVEKQGTTVIVKMYDTGGTVPGVTKASSTLLQTLTGTVSDVGVQTGAHISITSDQAAAQWGGIATGNGGVYVETWLPESFPVTFGGTLGGQAIGYDESVDSGPGTVAGAPYKQWAMRAYIPATSRTIALTHDTPDGSLAASTAYTGSAYFKTSGKGGTGNLVQVNFQGSDSALGTNTSFALPADSGETAWTRKTATGTTLAGTRRSRVGTGINPNSTATGTAFFMLPQLEQGSAATAWRNAPADDAPIVWSLTSGANDVLAADGEINSRDLSANIFLPWDATLTVHVSGVWANSGANADYVQINVGGTKTIVAALNGTTVASFAGTISKGTLTGLSVSAGKTRVPLLTARAAGTVTFYGSTYAQTNMTIVATRGK